MSGDSAMHTDSHSSSRVGIPAPHHFARPFAPVTKHKLFFDRFLDSEPPGDWLQNFNSSLSFLVKFDC
jgi:hypothetical protein